MTEPKWLTLEQVLALHNSQILRFGGAAGLRDEGLLSSAIARPVHAWHYGVADYAALGAGYAYGIVKNHTFIDGNKRTGFITMAVFLRRNAVPFRPVPADATRAILAIADGTWTDIELVNWVSAVIASASTTVN